MSPELRKIRRQLREIRSHVERFTGLKSRWTGRVNLSDEVGAAGQPAFWAKKHFACAISVHRAALDDPNLFGTLVHECFHSVSAGLARTTFGEFQGYEEGVVEQLTRMLAPRIAQAMDAQFHLESRDAFEDFVLALEALRTACRMDAELFYLSLLRTPLAEREQKVVEWCMEANRDERPARVLARIAAAMRELK